MNKKWFRRKIFLIPLTMFLMLVALRITLRPIVHKKLNAYLKDFSPSISFHIGDLDLDIFRGAYAFGDVTGLLKGKEHPFLRIENVDVSIAWRELLRGRVLTDVEIIKADFSFTKEVQDSFKNLANEKKNATEAKEKLFPVEIERVELKESQVTLDDYPSLKENEKFAITDINGIMKNLTPKEDNPFSDFFLTAGLPGKTKARTTGRLSLLAKPIAWNLDTELKGFDLTFANTFLRRKVPLTFTSGKLDVFLEAKSEAGTTRGYVKPFVQNLDVIKTEENFKGAKHWLIEVFTALGNLFLRASDTKTVATIVPFTMSKAQGFKVDSEEAIGQAIEHGFDKKLQRGLENKYDLK